jgi:hypothetical protein
VGNNFTIAKLVVYAPNPEKYNINVPDVSKAVKVVP